MRSAAGANAALGSSCLYRQLLQADAAGSAAVIGLDGQKPFLLPVAQCPADILLRVAEPVGQRAHRQGILPGGQTPEQIQIQFDKFAVGRRHVMINKIIGNRSISPGLLPDTDV